MFTCRGIWVLHNFLAHSQLPTFKSCASLELLLGSAIMSDSAPRPELVIAIDFGMTCKNYSVNFQDGVLLRSCVYVGTGVAYCNVATGEETVRWLQKWPGRANAIENKVNYHGK